MIGRYYLIFDGGTSCNNPANYGNAYGSYKIATPEKETLAIRKRIQHGKGSNNYAEAVTCLRGLQECELLGIKKLIIVGDSMIIVNRINQFMARKPKGFQHQSSPEFVMAIKNIWTILIRMEKAEAIWRSREKMVKLFGH